MPDALVDRVDDGLTVGPDFVDVFVEIENPSERLLRRRDVVTLRAEHDDRRVDIAEVDRGPVRCLDSSRGEIVADEQLIDDELHLLGVEIDVTSPPALEAQIARRLGVDLGIEVVLLGPERVGRILILEILHQPSAVEFAVPEIAGESGEPAAAQEPAAVAHRVLAVHAGPIGQWRAGDDDWAEQFGAKGGEHHDRPSRLAVADHARLAVGIGMQRDHLFEEYRLGTRDALDSLARHRCGLRRSGDRSRHHGHRLVAGSSAVAAQGET